MKNFIRTGGHCLDCANLQDWDENYDGDRWFSCKLDLEEDENLTRCPNFKEEQL